MDGLSQPDTTMENKTSHEPAKIAPTSSPTLKDDPANAKVKRDKKRAMAEISSIEELNFETFLYSDMNKFDARVIAVEKKVFQPKTYVITINVSNIPTIKTYKYFNEFKAFYKALKLRYANIQWPELAAQYRIFTKGAVNVEKFNQVLQIICAIAKKKDHNKKNLLGIFYAFFFDKDAINAIKKQTAPNSSSPGLLKKTASAHTDDVDHDHEVENEADNQRVEGAVEDSIMEFQRRYGHLLNEKAEDATNILPVDSKDPAPLSLIPEKLDSQSSALTNSPKLLSLMESENKLSRSITSNESPKRSPAKIVRSGSLHGPSDSVEQQQIHPNEVHQQSTIAFDRQVSNNTEGLHDGELDDDDNDLEDSDVDDSEVLGGILIDGTKQGSKPSKTEKIRNRLRNVKNNMVNRKQEKSNSFLNHLPTERASHNPGASINPSETAITRKYQKNNTVEDIDKELEQEELIPRRRARAVSFGGKEIPNYSGLIYMRLSSEPKWNKYFARISDGCMLLFKNMLDPSPIHYVPCFRCLLSYVQTDEEEYIEMWHSYDAEKFQISLRPKGVGDKDAIEDEKELSGWLEQIRIVSEKISGLNLEGNKYSPMGKFQVVVYQASNIQGLPAKSSCYVRLVHPPFTLATSKCPKNSTNNDMKWKQSFFIPICDTFFPITVEIVCAYNDGWITGKQKEEVICTGEILVADVISTSQNHTLRFKIPLKYTEIKAKTLAKTSATGNEAPSLPTLDVRLKNISSVKSLFAPPYGDYVEGVKINAETWSKQLMKLGLSRAKRIAAYLMIKGQELQGIFNFKYPLFSFVCFIIFTYIGISFDMADLIPSLILLLVMISIYYHPNVEPYVNKKFDDWFFQQSHLNPHYHFPRVQTVDELETRKMMQTEKWKYKLVDPDSLVTVIRKAKSSLVLLTIVLAKVTGFFEKLKNIVTWHDPMRTKVFILFSLVGYCALSIISFRLIVLLGIWGQFLKGRNHFETLKKRNREAAHTALRVIIKESYPEYQSQVFDNPSSEWVHIVTNFNAFQTKMVEKIKFRLGVHLPGEVLLIARSPSELVFMLGTCSQPLKVNITPAEEVSLGLYKKKTLKFKPKNLIYFIMNVPSDYYRVIHPRSISPADFLEN